MAAYAPVVIDLNGLICDAVWSVLLADHHGNHFYARTNENAINFKLVRTPIEKLVQALMSVPRMHMFCVDVCRLLCVISPSLMVWSCDVPP